MLSEHAQHSVLPATVRYIIDTEPGEKVLLKHIIFELPEDIVSPVQEVHPSEYNSSRRTCIGIGIGMLNRRDPACGML